MDIPKLLQDSLKGDRVAIGRAMSLLESQVAADKILAVQLLELAEAHSGNAPKAFRLSISGPPGVGKSTLIETLGSRFTDLGHQVGVLSIDPSSSLTKGSILGDRTRMQNLAINPKAFIRASSAGETLGGISRNTFQMMAFMEAIGFSIIFLETVGVGQSEHLSWEFTDGFIYVIQPGTGDELQGIKRGITELADIVIVNKADNENLRAALLTRSEYASALHLRSNPRYGFEPLAISCSALTQDGIDDVVGQIDKLINSWKQSEQYEVIRERQKQNWMIWALKNAVQELWQKSWDDSQLHSIQSSSVYRLEIEIEQKIKSAIADLLK